jgi:hypothetical protein
MLVISFFTQTGAALSFRRKLELFQGLKNINIYCHSIIKRSAAQRTSNPPTINMRCMPNIDDLSVDILGLMG